MDLPVWRMLATGRCFVYVFPCRERDVLKIGYARDPWVRLRAFHPQFHAFFDLDRGALIETDRVNEARAIEKTLTHEFASARDIAPLQVRERAGGKSEWFRGVHAQAMNALASLSRDLGYPMHTPLSAWLRVEWIKQIDHITDWIHHEFDQIEAWHYNADPLLSEPRERALRNQIAAWESIDLPLDARLAIRIRSWYRHGFDEQ